MRLALALCLAPALAAAQSIRGVVVDPNDRPVAGVVVILLDSASSTSARALSNVRGEYRLVAPRAGEYRVRTMRIGFRPTTTDAVALAVGREVTRRLVLSGLAIALDTVRVASNAACRMVADSAAATYTVWEQVRTALTAAQLTDSAQIAATTITYERTLDPSAKRIWKQAYAIRSDFVMQPWESMPPDALHRLGYVTTAGDWTTYFAPGIDALLSTSFVEDHCVRLVTAQADPSRLGISFEPTPARRQTPEIRGTLWLDRASSELRELEFGYVNVPRARQDQAGGRMDFARMLDGQWAISRWNIRMPVLMLGLSSGNEARVAEVRVAGGELSLVRRGADTIWWRAPLVLAGTVIDSTSGAAVARARVALHGTMLEGVSDASGRFSVPGVLPGEYILNVTTPSLDSVGAVVQTALEFTDTSKVYQVRLPTAQQIATGICGTGRFENPGIVIGSAFMRGDPMPPAGVKVVAEWSDAAGGRAHWLETRTDADGGFRLCGVPVNSTLVVRANADSAAAMNTDVRIPANGRFTRVELMMDRQLVGSAVFAGAVLTDSAQRPIVDAEVTFPALAKRVLTNERGVFRVADIPAGEHQLVVRRVGYSAVDTKIPFQADETVSRRILLQRSARLDTVVVTESVLPASYEDNRKIGLGRFFSRDELERKRGRRMSEVMAEVTSGLLRTQSGAYLVNPRGLSAKIPSCVPSAPGAPNPASSPGGLVGSPGRPNPAYCPMSREAPGNGIYCPESPAESRRGIICGCYAQVYLDKHLLNPQSSTIVNERVVRATPPYDLNEIGLDQIEAMEFYRSASETPGMYAALDSGCGVLVIHTRRSH